MLEEGKSFAAIGGREDIQARISLSQTPLEQARHGDVIVPETVEEMSNWLAEVLRYAETMEIPSLICDANESRAEMLLRQREANLAGQLLLHNLTLAKRNGMDLRLARNLTMFARVLDQRGETEQAEGLLQTSMEMAHRHTDRLEMRNIEKVRARPGR